MDPLILPAMGKIVPLLFFLENNFGIKLVDIPLKKKPNQTKPSSLIIKYNDGK